MNKSIKKLDLIIIGGGSAGMAAALSAYENGIKNLLMIEKEAELGGILLQCIHNGFGLHTFKEELTGTEYAYRYSKEIIEKEIPYLTKTFVLNIEKDLDGFIVTYSNDTDGIVLVFTKAIITSTGCSERNRGEISLQGDRPTGVMTAGMAQKYLNIEGYLVGKKVFILGSGDIGLIMARRMTLEGAKVLGVAEIMPYSNGLNRNIVQCLEDFNIPLYLSHTVKQVIGKTRLEKIILVKVDNELHFIEGTEQEIEVDTLLLSVGLIPNNPLLTNLGVAIHPKTKGCVVDEYLETSIEGIFACGNSLHVHDLVDFVSSEGHLAGTNASIYLREKLKKSDAVELINGTGISYILPSKIYLSNNINPTIKFRVSKPFKAVTLILKQNDKIIKRIKKPYLIPSEMEDLIIDKSLFTKDSPITLEVEA